MIVGFDSTTFCQAAATRAKLNRVGHLERRFSAPLPESECEPNEKRMAHVNADLVPPASVCEGIFGAAVRTVARCCGAARRAPRGDHRGSPDSQGSAAPEGPRPPAPLLPPGSAALLREKLPGGWRPRS